MRVKMRTKIVIIFVLGVAVAGIAWTLLRRQSTVDGFDRTQNVLPPETRKVLDAGQPFILLSLDPGQVEPLDPDDPKLSEAETPPAKETFHGYDVLGKTEIRDEQQRADLLRALYRGIADSNGEVARCFDPRHGISAALDGETVELVICFECLQIQTHAKFGKNVLTDRSAEPIFNRALQSAAPPIAAEK